MNDPVHNQHDGNDTDEAKVQGVKVYRGEELIMRLKEVRGVAHYTSHRPSGLAKKISDKVIEYKNKQNDDDEDEDEDPNKTVKIIAVVALFGVVIYLML